MLKKLHLVLHAHIPFVLDTDMEYWLHEAVLHSYLPFLKMLESYKHSSINITINLSPILLVQLSSEGFCEKFEKYLQLRKELLSVPLDSDEKNNIMYQDKKYLLELEQIYKKWDSNIIKAFQYFAEIGILTITTSAATHAFLPSLISFPHLLDLQIRIGKKISESFFPNIKGFWSPECAVFPELSTHLSQNNLEYLFADPASIMDNDLKTSNSYVYKNIYHICRNYYCTEKIWDAHIGYPGNTVYREFYKDLKEERNSKIHDLLVHYNIPIAGVSLYAITDKKSSSKEVYNPQKALEQIEIDSNNYIQALSLEFLKQDDIFVFFDMELFGHWWKEGVFFLDKLIQKLPTHNITLSSDLPKTSLQITPQLSTWGTNNNAESWINIKTVKLWEELTKSFGTIDYSLSQGIKSPSKLYYALLAQASDWTFLISHGISEEYSKKMILDLLELSKKTPVEPVPKNILFQLLQND